MSWLRCSMDSTDKTLAVCKQYESRLEELLKGVDRRPKTSNITDYVSSDGSCYGILKIIYLTEFSTD